MKSLVYVDGLLVSKQTTGAKVVAGELDFGKYEVKVYLKVSDDGPFVMPKQVDVVLCSEDGLFKGQYIWNSKGDPPYPVKDLWNLRGAHHEFILAEA